MMPGSFCYFNHLLLIMLLSALKSYHLPHLVLFLALCSKTFCCTSANLLLHFSTSWASSSSEHHRNILIASSLWTIQSWTCKISQSRSSSKLQRDTHTPHTPTQSKITETWVRIQCLNSVLQSNGHCNWKGGVITTICECKYGELYLWSGMKHWRELWPWHYLIHLAVKICTLGEETVYAAEECFFSWRIITIFQLFKNPGYHQYKGKRDGDSAFKIT